MIRDNICAVPDKAQPHAERLSCLFNGSCDSKMVFFGLSVAFFLLWLVGWRLGSWDLCPPTASAITVSPSPHRQSQWQYTLSNHAFTNSSQRLASLLRLVKAQDEGTPGSARSNVKENFLYSCLELECPIGEQSRQTFCKLDNQTLLAVGMAQTDAAEVAPGAKFTWTAGHNQHRDVDPSEDGKMYIERVYCMGKQFDVEEHTHGCLF